MRELGDTVKTYNRREYWGQVVTLTYHKRCYSREYQLLVSGTSSTVGDMQSKALKNVHKHSLCQHPSRFFSRCRTLRRKFYMYDRAQLDSAYMRDLDLGIYTRELLTRDFETRCWWGYPSRVMRGRIHAGVVNALQENMIVAWSNVVNTNPPRFD